MHRLFTTVLAMGIFITTAALSTTADNTPAPTLEVLVYPSLIYDDGLMSIHSDGVSSIQFLCYPQGEGKITDLAESSTLEVDMPCNLVPQVAAIMNRWKRDGGTTREFNYKEITYNGIKGCRWQIPLPESALYPALVEPLRGGMFGGIAHNLVNLLVTPKGSVPSHFEIQWQVSGKYNLSGAFPCYLLAMPEKNLKPKRVQLRSYGPLANVGHPPEEIEALIPIYQQIGIGWVDDQIADGPNRGYHELWQQAGFSFYCNRGFSLSAYSYDDRTASTNLADYAVGLDGTTTRGVAWQCYHGRIWCPIAIMTPGRYPFELMRKVIDEGVQSGVTMFDADLEIHPWSHCFCKNCLQQFADFAGLLPQQLANLENSEIILTYPDTWYTFRCEQTRRFYANLRNHAQLNYPGVQVGSDTVLQHLDQDFGNLRHGFCMFAEDPRLLDNTVDYFLADTLSGSVYDCIAVDAMHRTTTKPIISVAGSSYCVGFNPMVMAGRRMTANLTGDRYGYERRADLLKLGMVHQIASGAAGVRFEINEISVAAKAAEAADILARAEDYYLDGRRCDSEVEIYNLTAESSPWLKDRSRIGGRMWLHFYNKVGEGGRYTAHTTTNALLVSLFNWDHHQEKKWLVRLPPRLAQEYHLIELATQTTITPANAVSDTPWPVNELTQGIPITVPAAGLKVLLFTTQKPAGSNIMHLSAAELEAAREQSKKCRPFDPLQWYKGEQFDIKKAAKNGVDLALERLNLK